jgi:hypothetical protein
VRLAIVALCLMLAGCPGPLRTDPLLEASCPPLTALSDPSFGATTLKLIEVAGQYRECRCAALPKSCEL